MKKHIKLQFNQLSKEQQRAVRIIVDRISGDQNSVNDYLYEPDGKKIHVWPRNQFITTNFLMKGKNNE